MTAHELLHPGFGDLPGTPMLTWSRVAQSSLDLGAIADRTRGLIPVSP